MIAQLAQECVSCGESFWLGFAIAGLVAIVGTSLAISGHFHRREQELWENGHECGWERAVQAHREGRLQ